MKISIYAIGSRGDVQPFVALGKGLQGAGHQVLLVSHKIFEGFVRAHGLDFYPLAVDPRQVLLNQSVAEIGNNTLRISRWIHENLKPVLSDIFRATLEAAQGADVLLNSVFSFAGWHVAEKLNLPAIAAYLWPVTPSRHLVSATTTPPPSWLPFKGLYNYATSKFANQFLFNLLKPLTNACRQEILGLPPLSAARYWSLDSPSAKVLLLYGYSPTLLPKPPDWSIYQQVTGYWFLEGASGYTPPPELASFLDDGPPPVYVGFGSMVDHERSAMTHLVEAALQRVGQRGILLGGWSGLGAAELQGRIQSIDYAPHDWLFPRMAALVHHGGAGTTAAGLRAGLPNVIIPFFGDQAFWGRQVHKLGAGPPPIPRPRLSVENLAAAIQQAVSDQGMQRRAAALGQRIRAEDGITAAVRQIERFCQQ